MRKTTDDQPASTGANANEKIPEDVQASAGPSPEELALVRTYPPEPAAQDPDNDDDDDGPADFNDPMRSNVQWTLANVPALKVIASAIKGGAPSV